MGRKLTGQGEREEAACEVVAMASELDAHDTFERVALRIAIARTEAAEDAIERGDAARASALLRANLVTLRELARRDRHENDLHRGFVPAALAMSEAFGGAAMDLSAVLA